MAVKFTQTYKTYEDAAAEARRAQAMADMLQQQAYQPIQMDTAGPMSYTQGLAKMLQSYLAGKESRRAREAEAEFKRLGREEFKDYISAFEPERATTPVEMATAPRSLQQRMELKPQDLDLGQIAQGMGTPTISEQGAMGYTPPTGKLPSAGPMEFTTGTLTPAQRRAKIMQGMGSGNPLVEAVAQTEYNKKPEEFEIKETSQGLVRVGKTTGAVSPLLGPNGMPLTPRDAYSMGMTPDQKARYDLDVRDFGIKVANARLAQRQAADKGVDVSGLGLPSAPPTAGATPPTAPVRPPRPGQTSAPGQPPAPQANVPLIESNRISNEQKREYAAKQPQIKAATTSMLSEASGIDSMANDLLEHSGLDKITGPFGQIKTTDMAPEARSARAVYDSMKGRMALLRVAMARAESSTGGAYGNLTENEWPRLEQSLAAIGLAQDGDSLRNALNNFRSALGAITSNTQGIYTDTYGKLDFTPPKYNPESKRFPRQSSAPQQSRGWGKVEVVGGD